MMNRRRHRIRLLTAVVLAATVAGACGGGGPTPLEIGFRRVALDLAFKDAEKAIPVEPQTIIRQFVESTVSYEIEEQELTGQQEPTVIRRVRVVPPRQAARECPVAPEGSTPQYPAFAVIKDPPTVGSYPRHNEGKLTVAVGTSTFDLPVPPLSRWDIPRVEFVKASTAANDREVETLNPPDAARENATAFPEIPEFELTRRLMSGYSQTDTYRYTYTGATGGDYLYLVKRVTVARGQERVFRPSPPIRIVRLNVTEGNEVDAGVVHGGVDTDTNLAMTVQSQIVERELVDVCGEIADTYRVQIKENFVDLSKTPPEVSGNEGDTANFINFQFDKGLLIVREEVNSTLRTTTQVLGQQVPMTVTYNYRSTLDSLVPQPLAPPAATPGRGSGAAEPSDDADEDDE
jgi:hypothetical protein